MPPAHPEATMKNAWSELAVKVMLDPVTVVALRELDEVAMTPSIITAQEISADDLVSTNWYGFDCVILNTANALALKYCCSNGKGEAGN